MVQAELYYLHRKRKFTKLSYQLARIHDPDNFI